MSARACPPYRPALRVLASAAWLLASSTAHGQSCSFTSTGGSINFPTLDPSVSATLTAFADVGIRCTPASVTVSWVFSGANGSAPLRMKHATQNAFVPYTVTTTFLSGGANQTWRITGTVLAANYQNALVGTYSDILSATVLP